MAASSAPASLLGLLNASGHAPTVSACVATLNNLCASEEGADKVFEEAKRFAPHVSSHLSSSTSENASGGLCESNTARTALPSPPLEMLHL